MQYPLCVLLLQSSLPLLIRASRRHVGGGGGSTDYCPPFVTLVAEILKVLICLFMIPSPEMKGDRTSQRLARAFVQERQGRRNRRVLCFQLWIDIFLVWLQRQIIQRRMHFWDKSVHIHIPNVSTINFSFLRLTNDHAFPSIFLPARRGLVIPALLYFISNVLSVYALGHVRSYIFTAIMNSRIVFAAILSIFFLHKVSYKRCICFFKLERQ